jgi:hypothetical protein
MVVDDSCLAVKALQTKSFISWTKQGKLESLMTH